MKRGAAALVSLLLALGACEALTRHYDLAPRVYRMALRAEKTAYRVSDNPILGFEMKPNYRDLSDEPDLSRSFPYINADGQRDIERRIEKSPGKRRILMLGDSVVVGVGIWSLWNLVSSQLEKTIGLPDVEVLNFGVMGYNTRGEVELLRTKGLRYSPDMVVVVFVDNDLWPVNGDFHSLPADRPALVETLFAHSTLFRLACLRFDLFHFGLETDDKYVSRRQHDAVGAGDQIDEAVRLLAAMGRDHGFSPLIATWPTFTTEAIVDESGLYPGAAAQIAAAAARHGVRLHALRDVFDREAAANPREAFTLDGMHPNETGVRLMAESLRDVLLPLAAS